MSLLFAIAALGVTLGATPPQAAVAAAPASPQTPSPDVSLQFILTVGRPDGSQRSVAISEVTNGGSTHLWTETSFCGAGAGTRDAFGSDAIAWRVGGQILQRDGEIYTARLEWTRVSGGDAKPAAESPRTAAIRAGERVLLERTTAPATATCGGELKLEATVASPMGNALRGVMAGPAGGRGIGVGGGGGGRGSGGGAGRAGGGGAAAAASPRPDELSRALGVLAAQQSGALKFGSANPPLDAELWLVHRLPDGTEEVQQLKSRVGDEYTFKPVAIQIPASTVTVDVTGAVYQKYVNGTADGLAVLIRRRAKRQGSDTLELDGSSTSAIPTPSPGEVVSFPLPAATRGTLDTASYPAAQGRFSLQLDGHSFEIRLRISPAKIAVPMF